MVINVLTELIVASKAIFEPDEFEFFNVIKHEQNEVLQRPRKCLLSVSFVVV